MNGQNSHGDSALHIASKWGYKVIVGLLLEYGADKTLRNNRGHTPEDNAYSLRIMTDAGESHHQAEAFCSTQPPEQSLSRKLKESVEDVSQSIRNLSISVVDGVVVEQTSNIEQDTNCEDVQTVAVKEEHNCDPIQE